MRIYRRLFERVSAAALIVMALASAVQAQDVFKARLSLVPIDTALKKTVAGSGSATGTLNGNKLTISGNFEGLISPATNAHIHLSRVIGVRGPESLTLTVSAATSGTLSGSFDLTPPQVESLRKGLFYIQINSEKAPDGNLWGWLLH